MDYVETTLILFNFKLELNKELGREVFFLLISFSQFFFIFLLVDQFAFKLFK